MPICFHCGRPDDTTIHSIDATECIDDPRKQLEILEKQIARVEALLAQLVQKRVPLKRQINSLFSPVLQLPVEISSEIFATCFPPESWEAWQSKTPLALGKVCSAWRDLAWSMPCLWSTVSLNVAQCSDTHASLLSEWVGRSAQLPLSIHLQIVCDTLTPPEVRSAAHLLDIVALYSDRWREIDFNIPFFFPNGLHSLSPMLFPLLTNMSVHVMGGGGQVEAFRAAPCLQSVWLRGFTPNSVALPLAQITHVRLGPTTVDECLGILGGAPNLTHCIFEDIVRSDVMNPRLVLAQRLESFKVFSSTRIPLSEVLDAVSMPAARELVFQVTGNLFPHWSFVSLVARSSLSLERLVFTGIKISERNLWECLRAVPSLVFLELVELEHITDETISVLNPLRLGSITSTNCVLPRLETLVFTGRIERYSILTSMLKARWGPGDNYFGAFSQLRHAAIRSTASYTPDEDSVAVLRQLAGEGMRISLVAQDKAWT